ncbi:hypothetical protein ALP44_101846, partial [Pseudomonas syringae pv. theae]
MECHTHVDLDDYWGCVMGREARRCFINAQNKNPQRVSDEGFWNLILTMTYSHIGKPHTT